MAVRCFMRYIIFASYLVAGQSPQYGGQGLETVLIPNIPGPPENILWTHKGNKVVEFDGREQKAYDTYENRVIIDLTTAELTIKDLRHEDSGPYQLEVIFKNMLHSSNHLVEVIDAVAEPTISCVINDSSSSDTSEIQATLLCTAEPRGPPSLLRFEWRWLERVQPSPGLSIPLGEGHDNAEYTCRVSNPVSVKTAKFPAKNCYPDKSTSITLIVIVILFIVFILLLAVGIWYFWYYKKCCKDSGGSADHQTTMSPNQIPGKGSEEKEPLLPGNSSATPPSTQPLPRNAPSGQKVELEDTTSERKEDADLDHVTGKPAEEKLRKTDPSGVEEKVNEPDSTEESEGLREEKESSTLQEQTNTQADTTDDNQRGMEAPATKQENDKGSSSGETDEEKQSPPCTTDSGGSADHQTTMSPNQIPEEERGGSADHQTTMSPNHIPGKGHVSSMKNKFEKKEQSVASDNRQQPQSKNRPAKKQLFPLASPADTQTGSEEKEPLLPVNSSATAPSTQPLPRDAPSGQKVELEDTTSERKEDADSDQVTGKPAEEKLRKTDPSGVEEKINVPYSTGESEDPGEEKESSTLQEQTNTQADTTEGNQREMDAPATRQENDKVSSSEETHDTSNLSPDSSQQPQSSTPPTPDNTKTFKDQPGTQEPSRENHLDPKVTHPEKDKPINQKTDLYPAGSVQDKTLHEVQTPDKKNEARSDPNEEEPGASNSPTGHGEETEDHGAEDTGMEVRAESVKR